jgi:hypothetical protein
MLDLCRLLFGIVVDLFRTRMAMEAEILVLRQQIIVLRRGRPSRIPLLAVERMVLGWVCQLYPKTREALAIVRPDTVVRWHRAGFRRYWRWKSRSRWGRPGVSAEIRQLIREIILANPLWGAPRMPQTTVPNNAPIAAVAVIASAPQTVTRVAALMVFAPPVRADTAPSNARLISDAMETTGIACETGVNATAIRGKAAPTENVAAEVKAAWTGRELTVSEIPNSSRAWAARPSCFMSCAATCRASSFSTPRSA